MTGEAPLPWVVVAAGGAIETAFLPQRLFNLQADYAVRVSVALSPGARDFVTTTALAAITGQAVYARRNQLDPTQKPLHLALAEADLLVLSPATARILAECALGIVSCPVTRLFAFTPKDRVLVAAALHPRMDRRLYAGHVQTLRSLGCEVIGGEELFASWREVAGRIEGRLRLARIPSAGGVFAIEGLAGHRKS